MEADTKKNADPQPALPANTPRLCLSATTSVGTARCESDSPVILIGSRRDCHLAVPHPDVSKTHCAVINTGRAILVRDLLSRTGTFVNEQPIKATLLRPGHTLRVGTVKVEVESLDSSAAPLADGQPGEPDPTRMATPVIFEFAGRRVELHENAAVIGRRNTADLVLDSPDVSLSHALLFTLDGRPAICDLGSRSGTFVNGEKVELCLLGPGDQLELGGEKLRVWCEAPNAPAAGVMGPLPEPHTVTLPRAAELTDLEQTLAAVQSQVYAVRGRLEERRQLLDEREAELQRQVAELEAQRAALAAERAAAQEAQTAFDARQKALDAAAEACRQKEEELRLLGVGLEATAAEVTQTSQQIAAQEAQLSARQADHERAVAELARRADELAAREAALAPRAQDIEQREAALRDRESREAETFQKIEQFKSVLRRAGEMFAIPAQPADGAAHAGLRASQQLQGAAKPQEAGSVVQSGQEAGTPPSGASADELPAPIVDRPLFTAAGNATPANVPPGIRDRLAAARASGKQPGADARQPARPERGRTPFVRPGEHS
jgi:pSer/pThr/pTyr-binding forkhead associated (FHA) protein